MLRTVLPSSPLWSPQKKKKNNNNNDNDNNNNNNNNNENAGPSARTGACAAVVDGRMWVFGGLDMERGFLNDLYCFSIGTLSLACLLAGGNSALALS